MLSGQLDPDPRPETSRDARAWWLLGGLLFSFALLAWVTRTTGVYTGEDDAGYLLLSDALRQGTYQEWQWLGDPIANRFPPGYPALLMLARLLVPNGLLAATLLGIGLSVVGLVALYDVIRRKFGSDIGLASVAIIVVNPVLVADAGRAMSESVFIALILLTLWATARADETNRARHAGLAIAFAIAASFVRAAGLTVPLVLILHWSLSRRSRWVATLALTITCTIGAWHSWTVVSPSRVERRSYVSDAVAIVRPPGDQKSAVMQTVIRASRSTRTYVSRDLPWLLAEPTVAGTPIDNVLWLAFNVGTFVTGLALLWKRWRASALFLVVYGALLATWIFHVERFLQPALPLIVVAMLVGARWMASRIAPRASSWAVGAVLVVLVAPALVKDRDAVARATTCLENPYESLECASARSLDFVALARYAGRTLPDSAIVFAPKERAFHYHSGLKLPIMDAFLEVPPDSFAAALRAKGVTHGVLSDAGYGYRQAHTLLLGMCRELDVEQVVARESLLLAMRAAPLATPGAACAQLEHARQSPRDGSGPPLPDAGSATSADNELSPAPGTDEP